MDWQTELPLKGVELEFVTDDGQALTGQISYVGKYRDGNGIKHYQYTLRGGRGVFEVARWRRAADNV